MIKNIDHANVIHYGADALVMKVPDNGFSKPFCMKVLNEEFPSPEAHAQFQNEFDICSKTKCSSIRKAFRREKINGHEAIVFEFIEGKNLSEFLGSSTYDLKQRLQLATDITTALADIHKENILHRRINPDDILIENGTRKIFFIDFNNASRENVIDKSFGNIQDLPPEILKYIAPEMTGRINQSVDNRADLYSLGIVLYKVFTGTVPFEGTDSSELIYAHLAKAPALPSALKKDLPVQLCDILMKLLEKDVQNRYQSAFGLRYDLDKCLQQFQAKGNIEKFRLAMHDLSGKLFVSGKLYGRDNEVKNLNNLFEQSSRGEKNILFISGYSGSGKSVLADELKKPVLVKKGFYIKGKFDQIKSDTPYATFVQAFRELVYLILAEDEAFQMSWKKRLTDALGISGRVLTDVIPGLETLIGKQPDIPELKGVEAQNRFNYELILFLKTVAAEEHPLVIFMDDLQWADASSLNLLKIIAEERGLGYFMLVGAYRDNEVGENHILRKRLNELKKDRISFEEITLKDLSYDEVQTLVSDSLRSNQENAVELSECIFKKTKGNPFYVWQFLKSVYDEKFLRFDFDSGKWQWNTELIMQMNVSGNVVDLMSSFVQKLPDETLDLLKTASSIGNRFDKRSISVIRQINEKKVENLLSIPVSEGLLITGDDEYKFAHDRIQQAVYSLIPDQQKTAMHLLNGQKLTSYFNQLEFQDKLFDLVNQWNLGGEMVKDKKERAYLANLNLMAGRKAVASAAYPQALQYFEKGLHVMDETDWETQYASKLQMTTDAAEAAYLSGEYEKVDALLNDLQKHSKSLIDSVKGYEIEIKKLIARNEPEEAVKLGIRILQKLDIHLPLKPHKFRVFRDMMQTKWLLRNKSLEDFDSLPEMKDAEKSAAMRILSDIASASFFAVPELVPLLVFKMISLTVKYGLSKKSPFSFVAYGYIISVYLNEIEKGISYGEIALHLADKIHAEELKGSILSTYNIFLIHWKKRFNEPGDEVENAFRYAIESGDNEYASYAAHYIVYHLFISGFPLQQLCKKAEMLDMQIEKFKQDLTLTRLRIYRQSIYNLIEDVEEPHILSGEIFDETQTAVPEITRYNEIYFLNLFMQKTYIAIIFNLKEKAFEYISQAGRFLESVKGTALYPLFFFYRALATSSMAAEKNADNKLKSLVKKDLQQLKKFEKISPYNYTDKRLLVEAELKYLDGDIEQAKILFDKSLKLATENGIVNDLAISWERAGGFFINTKQDLLATFYLQNSYRAYKRWGATAKLKQMQERYVQLQKTTTDWQPETGTEAPKQRTGNLDLETVMKASTALSGEIVLPRLLKKMMEIILQNAGAQTAFLIMEKNGERFIEAEISTEDEEVKTLQSIPVKQSALLSEAVVNYVNLTKDTVILEDAAKSQLFANDEFIKKHESKSILCIPLMNMGKVQAIIYLSNDLTSGAFTEQRVALLKLLAGQMATSIENALFYNELENKVAERTNELHIEKKKSDDLLLNILPEEVADELKQTGRTKPRSYEMATVMFTDFEKFTIKSERLTPEELVNLIHTCFKKFDEIISKYNIEKIKTIGDAYLCVSGLPDPDDHSAVNVVKAAIEINDFMRSFREEGNDPGLFDIRIGIHSGPLIAGVVGDKKFAYDIWGDTVNTAARMEQNSEANKINISQSTYDLVKDQFSCTFRGKKFAKNKGMIEMYFVDAEY